MSVKLCTDAEQRALAAEDLPAFQGIKLLHLKTNVAHLLTLIGREKLFAEYTLHDISHIDAMLEMTKWVIPENTAEEMTPADWLLLVLSIYLHDLGMVVTRQEYIDRPKDQIKDFEEERLFSGENAEDYEARLNDLTPDDKDRFIFEEFVRETHGRRIRRWLQDKPGSDSGQIHREVFKLASPLPEAFRDDLGLICESHHLSDLGNHSKYHLNKPYGNSIDETANLQYAALILRTTDLLHITSDRVPPVLFRAINPTDPISQGEWVKQEGVRSVRPQIKSDADGKLDVDAQPDVVEVFANFDNPEGFFGLTSYLRYAESQLQRSHDWAQTAAARTPREYEFPWKRLDDANVEAKDYLPQPYEFTIDQQKVLKLLTGHTLYNQTDVVVRELVQNSLDAVRLQELDAASDWKGRVEVEFNSDEKVLHVTDNGTGMTQRIIEKHLLRVGASRYEDPEFRKEYPSFSAISRFGIGVLSTFMVADRVEILTAHPDEQEPRQLTLRTVHGRYLMRLLSNEPTGPAGAVLPHGTKFSLWLRPSATLGDIIEIMHRWIVIPRCEVAVKVDNSEVQTVGFDSPSAALEHYLSASGYAIQKGLLEVREEKRDGVHLAWAVRWSDIFRSWSVLQLHGRRSVDEHDQSLGLCVEGVRVEEGTPGYEGVTYAALANAVGHDAPRTNVARSGLEQTPQRLAAFSAVYSTMCDQVSRECDDMIEKRKLSPTWAAQEARWLLWPVVAGSARSRQLLNDAVKSVPTLLMEADGARSRVSAGEVERMPECWTIESNTFASAEQMLRELAADVSIWSLGKAFKSSDLELPQEPVITGYLPGRLETDLAFEKKEVDRFVIKRDQRRVDLHWVNLDSGTTRWRSLDELVNPQRRGFFAPYSRDDHIHVSVARGEVEVVGAESESAIRAFGRLFLLPTATVTGFVNQVIDQIQEAGQGLEGDIAILFMELALRDLAPQIARDPEGAEEIFERSLSVAHPELDRASVKDVVTHHVDLEELMKLLREMKWSEFDPRQWVRSE